MPTSHCLVQVTRGQRGNEPSIEIEHEGAIAVVSGDGSLLGSVGDMQKLIHLRSAAKPFQFLPFLLTGLHADLADIAVMISSHSGENVHTERVQALLERAGLTCEHLQCGVHAPYHASTRQALLENRQQASVLHNNCSGKHMAMLMVCQAKGWSLENYLDLEHPLQQWIVDLLLSSSGAAKEMLGVGIDGCSAPTFMLPLYNVAKAYSEMAQAQNPDPLARIFEAGVKHPELVAGSDRADTFLMQALPGQLFAKVGADGVLAMALAPTQKFKQGLGIAIKIFDGDSAYTARPLVAIEVLRQLGLLPTSDKDLPVKLQSFAAKDLKNPRGLIVSERKPTFVLDF